MVQNVYSLKARFTCSMFSLIFQFENEKEPNFKSIQKL